MPELLLEEPPLRLLPEPDRDPDEPLLLRLLDLGFTVDELLLLELPLLEFPLRGRTELSLLPLRPELFRAGVLTLRSPLWLPERLFQILVPFFRGSTGLIFPSPLAPRLGRAVSLR